MSEPCGAQHPQVQDITCIKPRTACFVVHEARRGPEKFSWPNERPRPTTETNRPKVNAARDRARARAGEPVRAETLAEGRTLRDEGISRILGHDDAAAEQWKDLFRDRFRSLLSTKEPFYADDIIENIGLPPDKEDGSPRSNLVGAMFNAEVRRASGSIQEVDRVQMTRASAHARKTSLWQGL